jgi:two-component system repressor protein LuxO
MIARHFLHEFTVREGKSFEGFTPDAEEAIRRYLWPGNVRELQNAMHQVVVLNDGARVEKSMLPESITSGHLDAGAADAGPAHAPAPAATAAHGNVAPHTARRDQVKPLWLIEKNAIEAAIEVCDGNINQAATLLEVAPSTLYRKLQTWKKSELDCCISGKEQKNVRSN